MIEEFRSYPYSVGYQVSNTVRFQTRRGITGRRGGINLLSYWKEVTPISSGQYLIVAIDRKNCHLGRVVLETFVGPCPDGMECCHGPRGKLDNALDNVSWGTTYKNLVDDKRRDGTFREGEDCNFAELTNDDLPQIIDMINEKHAQGYRKGLTYEQIGSVFGVTGMAIQDIAAGRNWKHLTAGKIIPARHTHSVLDIQEMKRLSSVGTDLEEIAKLFNTSARMVKHHITFVSKRR